MSDNIKTPEDILEEQGYDIDDLNESETILFRNPDYVTAIIGVSEDNRIVYDYNKMLDFLVQNEDMDYEEAADFVSYNTIRALSYMDGNTPIIMYPFID